MRVVSLELAKQLKEAGIEIETYWYWWVDSYGMSVELGYPHIKDHKPYNPKGGWTYFPAPTTDELLEWLPEYIQLVKQNGTYWAKDADDEKFTNADTPADALAKLALWVKEDSDKTR